MFTMSPNPMLILPEDPVPHHLTEQELNDLKAHSTSRLVWGEGNPEAPILVILDNPGARENRDGEPFLCGTRTTLQQGALQAGLELNQLYVTYLLKSRPLKKYDKEQARALGRSVLLKQIEN